MEYQSYLFSCYDLLKVYNEIITPRLGVVKHVINKEELIMGEFYYYLEQKSYKKYGRLSDFLNEYNLPTDMMTYFWHRFKTVSDNLIENIDMVCKRKLLTFYQILPGYQVEARIYTPTFLYQYCTTNIYICFKEVMYSNGVSKETLMDIIKTIPDGDNPSYLQAFPGNGDGMVRVETYEKDDEVINRLVKKINSVINTTLQT